MTTFPPEATLGGATTRSMAAAGPAPGAEVDWNTAPIPDLLDHLVSTHHDFLRSQLPLLIELAASLERLQAARRTSGLEGLRQILEAYQADVQSHLETEELLLFPAIRLKVRDHEAGIEDRSISTGGLAQTIARMDYEHEATGAVLQLFRKMTNGFTVPDSACATHRALIQGLRRLDDDSIEHLRLENDFLFPRVLAL